MSDLGWRETKDGNVVLTMTRDDWERLLMVLGQAGGVIDVREGRRFLYRHLALMNRINAGNPNWTAYGVPDD
jgi:hypothetical protein